MQCCFSIFPKFFATAQIVQRFAVCGAQGHVIVFCFLTHASVKVWMKRGAFALLQLAKERSIAEAVRRVARTLGRLLSGTCCMSPLKSDARQGLFEVPKRKSQNTCLGRIEAAVLPRRKHKRCPIAMLSAGDQTHDNGVIASVMRGL